MFNILSYYLLIKFRTICQKFNISTISKKSLWIFYGCSFIIISFIVSFFNYCVLKIILYYNPNNINLNLITKYIYFFMLIYLSFNSISSLYIKVFGEKDYKFILKFKKQQNKICLCKYISEVFLKNIYIPSIIYITINIAIFIIFREKYYSVLNLVLYYSIYIFFPLLYKYIIISFINLFKKRFNLSFIFKFFFKNSLVFLTSYFLSKIIINLDNTFYMYIYKQTYNLILFIIGFLIVSMLVMIILLLLFKNTNKSSNNKKNNNFLQIAIHRFNNRFMYYQCIILKRERYTLETLFESIVFVSIMILGISLNLSEEILINRLKMITFFSIIFSFELSETILKKILSIENDKSIIRHLINSNCLLKFMKSKIKMYFLIYNITNLFLAIPILLLGKVIDIIGLIITINIFSLIYSFNSVITNIVRPNFQLLKNEELEGTLINDIMTAFSKIANIIIYYTLGINLFAYNYLNKINNITLWMILIITMLSHLCILYLFYKRLLVKKIWNSWEGI